MLSFPNAKINIGLYVTGKRDDGYHTIESIFFPVPFTDVLEIIPSDSFFFESAGIPVTENPEDNLCVKAYRLFEEKFDLPPVSMFLLKNIPAGAGLGGGSSDAAFALKMLNNLFKLDLSVGQLGEYAAMLGSDCPFFVMNYPCYVFGRGELMEAVNVSLKGKYTVIVCPVIHINTAEAYRNIREYSKLNIPLPYLVQRDLEFWKESLQNDFENYAFGQYPVLARIKGYLYQKGAFFASMSGSGSSIFGIFDQKPELDFGGFKGGKSFLIWEGFVPG
jgi:4-diphosphocytidyl-2-C-methyl-D-erythritol kinase